MNILDSSVKLIFWEGLLNTSYLSGWVTDCKNSLFHLQQNNNPEHALHIDCVENARVFSEASNLIHRPITVSVRLSGIVDEFGQQCRLLGTKIQSANKTDLPPRRVQKQGGGVLAEFTHDDALESDDKESLARKIMLSVLDATGGVIDTRFSSVSNCASFAGFIGSVKYVPPTQYRQGYAIAFVRQSENPEEAIPVHLRTSYGITSALRLVPGVPVLVYGRLRRKVIPDDDGNIVSVHTYVEAPSLYRARPDIDIMAIPDWLHALLKNRHSK